MIRFDIRVSVVALVIAAGSGMGSSALAASCPEGYVEIRREVTGENKLRLYCRPIDTSTVDLGGTSLSQADKALMKHQWEMSVDWRYRNDPEVQQYLRNLWNMALSRDKEKSFQANQKLERILADQLKANGLSAEKIAAFFKNIQTFTTGEGPAPKEWGKASAFAQEMDLATVSSEGPSESFYAELEKNPEKGRSIQAMISPMFTAPQTTDDCVLHAIANGAQVPLGKVEETFRTTMKNLAMNRVEERTDPGRIVTSPKKGGRGGLNPYEEILIAEQFGKVIAVPRKSFARAIESTGRGVVTTVVIDEKVGSHEVVITGVHRTGDGKIYYSVMDSNLKRWKNFTAYIDKANFEKRMPSGGYVVMSEEKH